MAEPAQVTGIAEAVDVDYVNHRGERALRRIIPARIFFGATEWHPEPQWLLDAYDVDKAVQRAFAMSCILSWKPVAPR